MNKGRNCHAVKGIWLRIRLLCGEMMLRILRFVCYRSCVDGCLVENAGQVKEKIIDVRCNVLAERGVEPDDVTFPRSFFPCEVLV